MASDEVSPATLRSVMWVMFAMWIITIIVGLLIF
ncbi:hypothetical protein Metev_0126 [Methanohalobium evestigatum Z-7303]|jgi:hypothetical protein|uniref:Uncharacterized protein n=1 Tax=Methanohalobium evestigatum (strain ATCC BAA-1072 / DSM 3721 / NBRC 107634 / OCM 161 / Z-7303) TaxID=644295 RepID=D7E635_METEZ|nr:hypothetical protein Metev_0126 [Methanohalobium evestigatum Z-7303]